MRAKLKLVKPAPAIEKQRVGRKSDKAYGRDGHKYLTPEQVEALIKAAKDNRHGLRDASGSALRGITACGLPSWSICAGARSIGSEPTSP
jgi:hypothetical protein